ncbi:LgtD [Neisseria meningitidis]|uniref:Glycosyltransferase family 2 protein n=1 Tax=Neisseria meningitidis TaxID=487 RepID=A0A425B0R7_NEIME|nr:glycosyltransferase family 2 protein [Neisseria meningitidis]RQK76968.1 glycosyltransferase family 2 protein [Neisseria meningitidis]CWM67422.1 LgtD [Neisseria meningitidis]CWQ72724.1 LgtD [Neisseria meningitidis]
MQPLVSVLICAYNAEKYFAQSLAAVVNQTWRNLDILIVDDGSTDGTPAIARRFQEQDGRIRIISNPRNLGFIASLNIGLDELAKSGGEYIARTDADDIAAPGWIEKIVGGMEKDRSIIAMGAWLEVLSEENNKSVLAAIARNGEIWKNLLTHQEITSAFPFRNPIHNNTMIMRRSVIDGGLRFDPAYIHAEDYKFWYDVSKLGRLANYPEALVKYRFHQDQTSSKYNLQQRRTAQKIKEEIRAEYWKAAGIAIGADCLNYGLLKSTAYALHEKALSGQDIGCLRLFLYEYFLSLEKYSLTDLLDFLTDRVMRKLFAAPQYRKILKKMLRPWKYRSY